MEIRKNELVAEPINYSEEEPQPMAQYKNKYRIESTRLQNWDYGWAAAYFITICTQNRISYFGDVKNEVMQLSPVGAIADVCWHEIKNHAKNVELGEFVVMPNHIHGILILEDDGNDLNENTKANTNENINVVETRHALSLPPQPQQPPQTIGQQRFQNQGKNTVSSIIGGYKSAVTKHARRMGFEFGWQARFWDHIVRDGKEYDRIAQYITNNPKKWDKDKLNGGKGNVVLEPPMGYGEEIWMI